jgi:hypothetical protein
MLDLPPFAAVPADQQTSTKVFLNYEDITQDGRILLPAIVRTGGPVIWNGLVARHPAAPAMAATGTVPILSRVIAEGFRGPFGIAAPLVAEGGYQVAWAGRGEEVERLMLVHWLSLRGPTGWVHGPRPSGAGEVVPAGRVVAEHVFTRLFAPPDQRKVRSLDLPGFPAVPEARYPLHDNAEILALPPGASPLEPALSPDACPLVFGMSHTDSNQHVNSLVYPRLFEEAAVRRFASLGVGKATLLARSLDIGFRKPCFAGDRVRILLQAFRLEERWGIVGTLIAESDLAAPERARPHCYARMLFEP